MDSSSYLWLVDSGHVARGFECGIRGFEHNFPIWRVLQGSSALERDLASVVRLPRFPVLRQKLTGQYWENLERMMRYRRRDPIETWESMKEKLMLKYISLFFSQHLLDKWNRLTQGNKSAIDYIAKFHEYLNRCGAVEFECPEQALFRFRSDLRDDYRWELIAWVITTLEQTY